ncbi:MAG: hypothetical protein JXA91_00420 [Candidatus Thermoplasmatota archaeon]|nr:hypothetical protein [Candidatus Thermoplasmatota archaeon]
MAIPNLILIIAGGIIFLPGIGTLLNPKIERLINLPGNATVKAIISLVVGTIIIITGFVITLG